MNCRINQAVHGSHERGPWYRQATAMLVDVTRRRLPKATGRSPVKVLWRRGAESAKRAGWGVADQGISSVTNFLIVIVIAHSVGAVDFGAFSLAYVAYGFTLVLSRGLATYPLQVRFSDADMPIWRRATASAAGTALLTGVATGICALAAAAVVRGSIGVALLGLGLTLPGLLLQDSWRYAFFVLGRGSGAFINDTVWAVAQIPALLWLHAAHERNVFWFVLAWGGAAAVAALVGMAQARVLPSLLGTRQWLARHRDLSIRFTASSLITSAAAQVRNVLLDGLLGLAVVGYVQAASTLMGPFMVIFYGIGLVTVPEGVRILRRSPLRLPPFCLLLSCVLSLAALAWGGFLLLALPKGLGNVMLGPIWHATYILVLPQAIAIAGQCFCGGAVTGLNALGAARRNLRASVVGSVIFFIAGVISPIVGGALGTMIGAAIAGWITAFIFWRELHGAMREHQSSTVAPERAAQALGEATELGNSQQIRSAVL
jgi:O-antigen/teichoic acid export membrane protein